MRRLILAVLLLAGCNTPSPKFLGAERLEVSDEGVDYIVYRKEDRAQAIRLGSAVGVPPDELVRGFRKATTRATGCRTHRVHSNFQVSVIDFRLLCGKAAPGDEDSAAARPLSPPWPARPSSPA